MSNFSNSYFKTHYYQQNKIIEEKHIYKSWVLFSYNSLLQNKSFFDNFKKLTVIFFGTLGLGYVFGNILLEMHHSKKLKFPKPIITQVISDNSHKINLLPGGMVKKASGFVHELKNQDCRILPLNSNYPFRNAPFATVPPLVEDIFLQGAQKKLAEWKKKLDEYEKQKRLEREAASRGASSSSNPVPSTVELPSQTRSNFNPVNWAVKQLLSNPKTAISAATVIIGGKITRDKFYPIQLTRVPILEIGKMYETLSKEKELFIVNRSINKLKNGLIIQETNQNNQNVLVLAQIPMEALTSLYTICENYGIKAQYCLQSCDDSIILGPNSTYQANVHYNAKNLIKTIVNEGNTTEIVKFSTSLQLKLRPYIIKNGLVQIPSPNIMHPTLFQKFAEQIIQDPAVKQFAEETKNWIQKTSFEPVSEKPARESNFSEMRNLMKYYRNMSKLKAAAFNLLVSYDPTRLALAKHHPFKVLHSETAEPLRSNFDVTKKGHFSYTKFYETTELNQIPIYIHTNWVKELIYDLEEESLIPGSISDQVEGYTRFITRINEKYPQLKKKPILGLIPRFGSIKIVD